MYDELIKNLRGMAKGFCPFDIGNKMCGYFVTQEAANAIDELCNNAIAYEEIIDKLESKSQKWIPVTERLPEEDGKYLTVYTLNSIPPKPWIEVCWFAKNLKKVDKYDFPKKKSGFYQSDSEYGFYEVSRITHWMPLPEPPKEG